MRYFFYDTETTGLTRNDEVIQLAGFLTDEKLHMHKAVNFYCYTQVPINKKAQGVHGIDASSLWKLSEGRTFEDQFYELSFINDEDIVWISYSNGGFDERLITQTLRNNGLKPYNFGTKLKYFGEQTKGIHTLDIYNLLKNRCFAGKDISLAQATKAVGITSEHAERLIKHIFPEDGTHLFHDALFDALMLLLLTNYYKRELGLCEL